jgi:hypothetical protein
MRLPGMSKRNRDQLSTAARLEPREANTTNLAAKIDLQPTSL